MRLSNLQYSVRAPVVNTIYTMPCFDLRNRDYYHQDYELITTIEKVRDIAQELDLYFIRLERLNSGQNHKALPGYIYFSYDEKAKSSTFYGSLTRGSFRNRGISSYLISRWIEICIMNDIENLYTISKQRKPIVLYSLKKHYFELDDMSEYKKGHSIIICKDNANGQKVLYFQDETQKELFKNSSINRETPHVIIDRIGPQYSQVAEVVLEKVYHAQDLGKAENLSNEIINHFSDRIRIKN